jgi:hypothetical protein
MADVRSWLQSDADITFYGPDGEPIDRQAQASPQMQGSSGQGSAGVSSGGQTQDAASAEGAGEEPPSSEGGQTQNATLAGGEQAQDPASSESLQETAGGGAARSTREAQAQTDAVRNAEGAGVQGPRVMTGVFVVEGLTPGGDPIHMIVGPTGELLAVAAPIGTPPGTDGGSLNQQTWNPNAVNGGEQAGGSGEASPGGSSSKAAGEQTNGGG